jgi:glycolate oxidase FAD binding subunit
LGGYSIDGLTPQVVVQPIEREGIQQVLRWASAEKAAVLPRGGGTQLALGNVPSRVDLVLDLSRCNRILDHQPADLTTTVEAGITLEALQRELARQGQFVPVEAPLPDRATIGGILAANASGPLRFTYGLAREWLIGIHVVSASGVETKAGGKVVKNVTGYDLNKLYAGSLGTLGVIVEATFKLSPLPPDSGMLVAAFPSMAEAADAVRALLGQVFAPQGLQIIDTLVAKRLNADTLQQLNVTGGRAIAIAFFSGRSRAVQRKLDQAARLLRDSGAAEVERLTEPSNVPISDRSVLRRVTDLGWSKDTTPYLGLKINVSPSAVGQVIERSRGISALGLPPAVIADAGFGGVRFMWWPEGLDIETLKLSNVVEVIDQTRGLGREAGGSVVVEHCPLTVKQQIDVWGDEPQGIEIMRRIKQQFDPLGILNPGRFVGRI